MRTESPTYPTPEFLELMAQPSTRHHRGHVVGLRLIAEVGTALNSLTDQQLAKLPDEGVLGFDLASIATIDIECPWVKFSFDSLPNGASPIVEDGRWLHSAVGWLAGLHEWLHVEAKLRGTMQGPRRWADQPRCRRIVYAHTYIHILEPLSLITGWAESAMDRASRKSAPRSRSARRRRTR